MVGGRTYRRGEEHSRLLLRLGRQLWTMWTCGWAGTELSGPGDCVRVLVWRSPVEEPTPYTLKALGGGLPWQFARVEFPARELPFPSLSLCWSLCGTQQIVQE